MPKLLVIIGSTRPERIGLPIGRWFADFAQTHGTFEVEVADLKEINLPLLDEPQHPRLGQYQHEHTIQWSGHVNRADAIAMVIPEYNYSMTAPVKNALDYLYHEWCYKPLALVSYGGASGGLRAAQMVKQVATTLKMMPLPEGVSIPFAVQHLKAGTFEATDTVRQAAQAMLDELGRWEKALRQLRESQRQTSTK